MRFYDNGCFYTVQCTSDDVAGFAAKWPCFGPRNPIAFQFDKRNGDLVDVLGDTANNDESGIRALSEDAQAYGKSRMLKAALKGYRFYAEMPSDRASKSACKKYGAFTVAALRDMAQFGQCNNVIAVPLGNDGAPIWQGASLNMDCFGAVRDIPDSSVCGTSTSRDYLRKRCVRVSAELAMKLHPSLVTYLTNETTV